MENKELYKMLELPNDVIEMLDNYEAERCRELPNSILEKMLSRPSWDEGVGELKEYLSDDPSGIKALWEQLNIVRTYSYPEYVNRGISQVVFTDTMKFCTRFLNERLRNFGEYRYFWAWWFPRQMSLYEFRVGALEYEFIDGIKREIAVHIPSDADMRPDSIQDSLNRFDEFRQQFFKDWADVDLTCESWMMVPELQDMLGEKSNITAFQKLFEIQYIDREATWFMEWIYPGYEQINEELPEKTSLQRELKKYLLAGQKFGIAKGTLCQLRKRKNIK